MKKLIHKIRTSRDNYNRAHYAFMGAYLILSVVFWAIADYNAILEVLTSIALSIPALWIFVKTFYRPSLWSYEDREKEDLV